MSSDIYFRVCHKLLLWSVFLNGWIFCSSSAFNQLYLMNKVWSKRTIRVQVQASSKATRAAEIPQSSPKASLRDWPKSSGVTEADYVRPEALNMTLEWLTVRTSLLYLLMQSLCWKTWEKSDRTLAALSADVSPLFIAGGFWKHTAWSLGASQTAPGHGKLSCLPCWWGSSELLAAHTNLI